MTDVELALRAKRQRNLDVEVVGSRLVLLPPGTVDLNV